MDDDRKHERAQWAAMRAHAPVYRDEPSKSFVLTRYADVRALVQDPNVLRDPDLAEEGAVVRQFKPADAPDRNAPMTWMDGAEHRRVRGPLQKALYARAAKMRPQIESVAYILLDRLSGLETFDLVADYAAPLPVDVIGAILGVEMADLPRFRVWSEAVMLSFHPSRTPQQDAAMAEANAGLGAYFDAVIAERRLHPRDDLISDLAQLPDLSAAELRVNCATLLTGGNMTIADLVGHAVLQLLLHPDQLAKLKANPALMAGAIEETLRFSPPASGTQRILEADRTLHGCPMHKGQVVAVMIPAANRDPDAFADPDRFDIARRPNVHMSFGGGTHICIGAPLARMEAQVAVAALFERFPNLHLTDAPPRWRDLPFFYGLESLTVAV